MEKAKGGEKFFNLRNKLLVELNFSPPFTSNKMIVKEGITVTNNSQWLFIVHLYFLLMIKVKENFFGKNPETRKPSYKELFNLYCYSIFCLVPVGPEVALIESFCLCLKKLACVQFQWMRYLIGVRNWKDSEWYRYLLFWFSVICEVKGPYVMQDDTGNNWITVV